MITAMNLDKDMLVLMHDVARLMRTRFDQRARAYGMTRAQWVILARLDRQPGMTQNEMASLCEVEPITVGRLVDRLEARGLVLREAAPHDRRSHALRLSPAGVTFFRRIEERVRAHEREIARDLSASERALLIELLQRVARAPS